MKNESKKKSPEKSKNVIEEKRKTVKRKICIKKTHTFTIIAMNCVQEQLKTFLAKKTSPSLQHRYNYALLIPCSQINAGICSYDKVFR